MVMPAFELSGQKFNLLLAIERTKVNGKSGWLCRCDCGRDARVQTTHLRKGTTKSCGCLSATAYKSAARANITHGMTGTRVFRIWSSMLARCNDECKPNYGARGISVCDRWLSFKSFLEDMGEPPGPAHQIDRIDNEGNYEPSNCRWTTPSDNGSNRRSNRLLTFDARTQTLTQWSRELGITSQALNRRIDVLGWTIDRALTQGKR